MNEADWKEGEPLVGAMNLPENHVLRGLIHDGNCDTAFPLVLKERRQSLTDVNVLQDYI